MSDYHVHTIDFDPATMVRLATGHLVPGSFEVVCVPDWVGPNELETLEQSIELAITVRDGRALVTRFLLRASAHTPVTQDRLRDVHLQTLLERAVAAAATVTAFQKIEREEIRPSTRRRRLDDALLVQVARIVRDHPDTPNLAVQEQLFTTARTASRWIKAARERFPESEEG